MIASFFIVKTLNRKYENAIEGTKESSSAFQKLTKALGPDTVEPWEEEANQAMIHRGEYLKIYNFKTDKGLFSESTILLANF